MLCELDSAACNIQKTFYRKIPNSTQNPISEQSVPKKKSRFKTKDMCLQLVYIDTMSSIDLFHDTNLKLLCVCMWKDTYQINQETGKSNQIKYIRFGVLIDSLFHELQKSMRFIPFIYLFI